MGDEKRCDQSKAQGVLSHCAEVMEKQSRDRSHSRSIRVPENRKRYSEPGLDGGVQDVELRGDEGIDET